MNKVNYKCWSDTIRTEGTGTRLDAIRSIFCHAADADERAEILETLRTIAQENFEDAPQAQEGGRWISVKEQLPTTTEMIISARRKSDGKWGIDLNYWTVSNKFAYQYTHWMPLAAAPKGE